MKVEVKKFQANRASDIAAKCSEQDNNIIEHIIKLTCIDDPENKNQWITHIYKALSSVKSKPKGNQKFSYLWYLDAQLPLEDSYIQRIYNDIIVDYPNVNPIPDYDKVNDNLNEIRYKLAAKHLEKYSKEFLTKDEIYEIINSLNIK